MNLSEYKTVLTAKGTDECQGCLNEGWEILQIYIERTSHYFDDESGYARESPAFVVGHLERKKTPPAIVKKRLDAELSFFGNRS